MQLYGYELYTMTMKIYTTIDEFLSEYWPKSNSDLNKKLWQVVDIVHVSDERYALQVVNGADELGFQPLNITVAHPLGKESRQVLIKNINDTVADSFRNYCRSKFVSTLPERFVSMRPDETQAYTEYPRWEDFYKVWLERDGQPVFHANMPLLFDHMPDTEYLMRRQTGQKVLSNQRLLVTTYFVHKKQFYDFFIKNVNDVELQRIKNLLQSRVQLHQSSLFKNPVASP